MGSGVLPALEFRCCQLCRNEAMSLGEYVAQHIAIDSAASNTCLDRTVTLASGRHFRGYRQVDGLPSGITLLLAFAPTWDGPCKE